MFINSVLMISKVHSDLSDNIMQLHDDVYTIVHAIQQFFTVVV